MSHILFKKYQGIGNDFVIIDYRNKDIRSNFNQNDSQLIRDLCNRNYGIGADGIILIDYAQKNDNVKMIIYNSDGNEAEMCGNGLRCLIKLMYDNKEIKKDKQITIETKAGKMKALIDKNGDVTVNMGMPILKAEDIPTTLSSISNKFIQSKIEIDSKIFDVAAVGMGNPHLILFVKDLTKIPLLDWGPTLENSKYFPKKTNVHFVEVIDQQKIKVLVWERSCGPTLACGTGACACLVATSKLGLTKNEAKVELPGGVLNIRWPNETSDIFMKGPAKYIYSGKIDIRN